MSDGEFENYLTLIGRLLRLSPAQREAIGEELRDHFESRLAELLERGLAHDEAVRIALEEFGDAAGLAASFTSISQTRRRRLIMRCTVGSIAAIAAAVVVAMAVWPENHAGRVVAKAEAQDDDKRVQPPPKAPEKEKTIEELTAQTEATLNKLTVLEFDKTPLNEVINYIGDKHHLQFYVQKQSFEETGLDPNTLPVTFYLHDVRVKTCLAWILSQHDLGYTIREGVIVIATKSWLDKQLETRVYDCRDILAADAFPQRVTESKSSIIVDPAASRPDPSSPAANASSPAERLSMLIQTTVAPNTWFRAGGTGSIVEYQGLLIVGQTAEVQAEVKDLLSSISSKLGVSIK